VNDYEKYLKCYTDLLRKKERVLSVNEKNLKNIINKNNNNNNN
jgi:hypothetical protein